MLEGVYMKMFLLKMMAFFVLFMCIGGSALSTVVVNRIGMQDHFIWKCITSDEGAYLVLTIKIIMAGISIVGLAVSLFVTKNYRFSWER